ncbi:MAG: TatD family hydrolase [Kiritimatiellae bacterium]|nr:TatD family hydrolase [Kiritimatiellia bacterium]
MVRYFDTHAHFTGSTDAVAAQIERAVAAGVTRLIAVGGSPVLNAGARAAAASHPLTVALAVGLDRDQSDDPDPAGAVAKLLDDPNLPPLAAVGEIGLDYHYRPEGRPAQCALMEAQLAWAARRHLPVIVHAREADADTLALLRNAARDPWFREGRPGVIHCFTGGQEFADNLLTLGYFLSFSGIVTFANAAPLRAIAARVPAERLLIETDSPYLTPVPLRGRTNEPAHVVHVAACLAKQRGLTPEALAEQTFTNACLLFGQSGQGAEKP